MSIEHIYFFFQYIGQSLLTGNRSVSLNRRRNTKKEKEDEEENIGLSDTHELFLDKDKKQKVHHILLVNLFDRVV